MDSKRKRKTDIICWLIAALGTAGLLTVGRTVERTVVEMWGRVGLGVSFAIGGGLWGIRLFSLSRRRARAHALLREGKLHAYIEAVQRMLGRARRRRTKNLLRQDLAVGYGALKQYGKAIAILEPLSREPLPRPEKAMCLHNLCCYYFDAGQREQALALYDASREDFAWLVEKWPDMNEIRAAIARGERERAGELLERARRTWDGPELKESFRVLEEELEGMGWGRPGGQSFGEKR